MKILLAGNAVTASIFLAYLRRDARYKVAGCVVDDFFVDQGCVENYPTIGLSAAASTFSPESHRIIMAMGYNDLNRLRESMFLRLTALGYGVETYVHPDARVYTDHALGQGAVVLPGAVIEPNARVGANTMVWSNVTLAHDSSVGDHCWVAAGTVLSGHASVLRNTFVGVGSTIVNKITVSEYNIVGAGALISRDTKPHSVHLARSAESFRYSSDDYVKHFGL
jgi:sugar O-acyltransferase (sialic acid O-acetyltransferase NeuD family)